MYYDDVVPPHADARIHTQDPRVNRLEDSLLLWRSIVANKLLANVNIILFLNKCDLLQVGLCPCDSGVFGVTDEPFPASPFSSMPRHSGKAGGGRAPEPVHDVVRGPAKRPRGGVKVCVSPPCSPCPRANSGLL